MIIDFRDKKKREYFPAFFVCCSQKIDFTVCEPIKNQFNR